MSRVENTHLISDHYRLLEADLDNRVDIPVELPKLHETSQPAPMWRELDIRPTGIDRRPAIRTRAVSRLCEHVTLELDAPIEISTTYPVFDPWHLALPPQDEMI